MSATPALDPSVDAPTGPGPPTVAPPGRSRRSARLRAETGGPGAADALERGEATAGVEPPEQATQQRPRPLDPLLAQGENRGRFRHQIWRQIDADRHAPGLGEGGTQGRELGL